MTKTKSLELASIYAELNAHPPLMREQAKAAYLGQDVDWVAAFANG